MSKLLDFLVMLCALIVLGFSLHMVCCAVNPIAQAWGVALIVSVVIGMYYIYKH